MEMRCGLRDVALGVKPAHRVIFGRRCGVPPRVDKYYLESIEKLLKSAIQGRMYFEVPVLLDTWEIQAFHVKKARISIK
jgi:hypothetical protein